MFMEYSFGLLTYKKNKETGEICFDVSISRKKQQVEIMFFSFFLFFK